jgi:hypothetical protein
MPTTQLTMFPLCSISAGMGRSIKTLDDAARYRMRVAAKCEDCLRIGKFMATDLASHCGRQKRPSELHFTCSDCGSKNVSVTLEEWGDIKQSEIVVWKPVTVTIPR